MNIIIHIGLPKCGSTSIQNQLFEDSDDLVKEHGIFFQPTGAVFHNHFEFSKLAREVDRKNSLIDYLSGQIESAKALNCKTIVLSSEDLFYFLQDLRTIFQLESALQDVGFSKDEITFVMVYRKLENFLKSYRKQLVSNGKSILDMDIQEQMSFHVSLMRRFFKLCGNRISISLDKTQDSGGLISVFYTQVLGISFNKPERIENISGNRGVVSELLIGPLVGMSALIHNRHPNDPTSDLLRQELQSYIDIESKKRDVGIFLAKIEEKYDIEFLQIFEKNLHELNDEDSLFIQILMNEALSLIPFDAYTPFLSSASNADIKNSKLENLNDVHNDALDTFEVSTRYGELIAFKNDLISDFLVSFGEWSYFETSFLNLNLPSNLRIFDIGSYIGTFSLAIAESKPAFILSVEANPTILPFLESNLQRNLKCEFSVFGCAVGIEKNNNLGNYADIKNLGSFTSITDDSSSTENKKKLLKSYSLKDLRMKFGAYNFLKLDIEGAEIDALRSDEVWIRESMPILWAECNESYLSIELYKLIQNFGYDIYFYRYPAYNPLNFNNNDNKIFPIAFEAGLLAVKPGTVIKSLNESERAGASYQQILSADQLRKALWLTPRWGKSSWENLSKTELLGLCARLSKKHSMETFLSDEAPTYDVLQTADPQSNTFINFKFSSQKFHSVNLPAKKDEQYWMQLDINKAQPSLLIAGALALEQFAITSAIKQKEEAATKLRLKIVEYLRKYKILLGSTPEWLEVFAQTNLLECGVLCNKIAEREQTTNDAKAVYFWEIGVSLLEELFVHKPEQESWVKKLFCKQVLEGAVTYGRLANSNSHIQNDAASYHEQGAKFFAKYIEAAAFVEPWVFESYLKQLIEGSVIFDRIAHNEKTMGNDNCAATHWKRALSLLSQYIGTKNEGEIEDWIITLHKKALLEYGLAIERTLVTLALPNSQARLDLLILAIESFHTLFETYPAQEEWVLEYYQKHLTEGIICSNHLALHYKEAGQDLDSVTYWRKAIVFMDELLNKNSNPELWVLELHQKMLIECGVAYDRIASINKENLQCASNWKNACDIFEILLDHYPNQPDWIYKYHEKALLNGYILFNKLALKNVAAQALESINLQKTSLLIIEKLLARYPNQPNWVTTKHKEIAHDLMTYVLPDINFQDNPLKIENYFANQNTQLSGLVKLIFICQSSALSGRTILLKVEMDNGTAITRRIQFDTKGSFDTWIGIHTHLLVNGQHSLKSTIFSAELQPLWQEDIIFDVENNGNIANIVRQSLMETSVNLFVPDYCDAKIYDYSDSTLNPWFDQPNALEILDDWLKTGVISLYEYGLFKQFVIDGYFTLDAVIDDELLSTIDTEITNVIKSKYQGYERGSSQRLTLLHKICPGIRQLFFDRRFLDVLDKLFQSPAQLCQSLLYIYGSQQDAHQDTVHLTPFPAGYMCGVWIALEDIQPDSGELEIYPKSHRFQRRYMHDLGCAKVTNDWSEFGEKFIKTWRSELDESKLQKVVYRPKKGSILIWHENLMHAGGIRKNVEVTRKSIVFHCFADGTINYYDSTGDVAMIESKS